MKELTIEEKAKVNMDYKERLKRAKELYPTANADQRYVLESLFPELKESEDEKIRKDIIKNLERYVKYVEDGYDAPSAKDFIVKEIEKQIAWLEKQVEQNPAWSEEDEKILYDAIGAVGAADYYTYDDKVEIERWLKSLKQRIGG